MRAASVGPGYGVANEIALGGCRLVSGCLTVSRGDFQLGGKKGQSTPMSDLMVITLFIIGGLAVFTAVVAVLTPGRLFRADPPSQPERDERQAKTGSRR